MEAPNPLVETPHFDLLNATPAHLVVLDADGRIEFVNRACQRLLANLGVPAGALRGQEFHRLTGPPFAAVSTLSAGRLTLSIGGEPLGASIEPVSLGDDEQPGAMLTLTPIGSQRQLRDEVARVAEAAGRGAIEARISTPLGSAVATAIGTHVNDCLDAVATHVAEIDASVIKLRECDLDIAPNLAIDPASAFGRLRTGLDVTVSNLTESIRQTLESSAAIASTTAQIAEQNGVLAQRTDAQADYLRRTSSDMEQLSAAVTQASRQAAMAAQQGQITTTLVGAGRDAVQQVSQAMDEINSSAERVSKMLSLINDIAFQTNILAINAAVEAAHAGERGRGFAVVAQEVRALAARSADAANQIRTMVTASREISERGKTLATNADHKMLEILQNVEGFSARINAIAQTAGEQTQGIQDANQAIAQIDAITQQNNALVAELATNTGMLDRQASFLMDAAKVFRLPRSELSHPLHEHARELAVDAAGQVGRILEGALRHGRIAIDALFSEHYAPIAGTDPVKYHTAFDALCDELLPAIQEPLLDENPEIIYAIASDRRGYVPTHNARFSQPLTGAHQADLVGNRTKRLFTDRVGQQVGTHTQTWKLQTYRRDTGELMFDMSAPIVVGGRHWGGFRIGYRIT
ncbi:MAG: methyl-accepting chemotaxis protein [Thiotrichales bacterium]